MLIPNTILFLVISVVITINIYLFCSIIYLGKKAEKKDLISLSLLLAILIGSTTGHLSWFIKLLRTLLFPEIPYSLRVFFIRIAHAFLAIQYQSLVLLISRLLKIPYFKSFLGKLLIGISSCFTFYFAYAAFFEDSLINEAERCYALKNSHLINAPLEICMMRHIALYLLPLTSLFCIWILFKGMRKPNLPKIIKQQINVLIKFLVCPLLFIEVLIAFHRNLYITSLYTVSIVGISTLLTTAAIYYCFRMIIPLRFLNLKPYVESPNNFHFIHEFAHIIEQMDQSSTIEELTRITQQFFKDSLSIPINKTSIYILNHGTYKEMPRKNPEQYLHSISTHSDSFLFKYIKENKVIIYDDVVFNQYCDHTPQEQDIITFLDAIQADIFLPIFRKDTIIAAVIVKRDALPHAPYNQIHRNELIIFSTYVGNTLHSIQVNDIEQCMITRRKLENELYDKHLVMEQYRESIQAMIRLEQQNIGIIFYKNRRFTYANEAAKEIVSLNLNTHIGHPLAKEIKKVTRQVEEYHVSKKVFFKDIHNRSIVIYAVPNLEQNGIIITLSRPDATELLKKQINHLKDPSTQDYLLYLKTTQSGKLVNSVIPGSTPTMINFKINLLKIALSKKPILLDIPPDDLIPTVELIHTISLHDKLHILELHNPCVDTSVPCKLFGSNQLLNGSNQPDGLLKTLDTTGTLCIKNIHYLDYESQYALAEYIQTGYFKPINSSNIITSNVRLIFSSNNNLKRLVQENKFNPELFKLLQHSSLMVPSLHNLPSEELHEIISELANETIPEQGLEQLFYLTQTDRQRILNTAPASICELKKQITRMLFAKSKETHVQETEFESEYTVAYPELAKASRLGRYALKDKSTMSLLWDTLKNQNKIAELLGVNRSSVSRRCKEYGLR